MKVLYAIQGTGNGHITRAREILPEIRKFAEVDVLISGMHSELELGFAVKYRLKGLGFKFGKQGGVDVVGTWWHGDIPNFFREVRDLHLREYNFVINDFEPVSAWAARRQGVKCIGLSNQCVLLDSRLPKPKYSEGDALGIAILRNYAPVDVSYGFFYQKIDKFIQPPVIRKEIRDLKVTEGNHYLVYLPFYHDKKIVKALTRFGGINWIVFSKHAKYSRKEENVEVLPLDSTLFTQKLASCRGVISAAGFGLTTEVLYLGKKLLVIPMKNQFEQRCNAYALSQMGVPVVKSLKPKWRTSVQNWIQNGEAILMPHASCAKTIVQTIFKDKTLNSSSSIFKSSNGSIKEIDSGYKTFA